MSATDTGRDNAEPKVSDASGNARRGRTGEHRPRPAPSKMLKASEGDDDFDHHDTIPAPTWLDESPDTQKAPAPQKR